MDVAPAAMSIHPHDAECNETPDQTSPSVSQEAETYASRAARMAAQEASPFGEYTNTFDIRRRTDGFGVYQLIYFLRATEGHPCGHYEYDLVTVKPSMRQAEIEERRLYRERGHA